MLADFSSTSAPACAGFANVAESKARSRLKKPHSQEWLCYLANSANGSALLLAGSAGRRALLPRGTDRFVVAEPAGKAGLGGELARANIGGGFPDFTPHRS